MAKSRPPINTSQTFPPAMILAALKALATAIRDAVIAGRATAIGHAADVMRLDDGTDPTHGGDTIYRIDIRAEEVVLEACRAWADDPASPVVGPFALIAEGLPGDGWRTFPANTPREDVHTVVIVDPIDGTRGLMHGKRSAWALLASGPGPARLGRMPHLRDLEVAVMAEVPTERARLVDTLWATRGGPAVRETLDLATGAVTHPPIRPSGAPDLAHGFASIAKFFPGTKVLAATIEERLFAEALGDPPGGAPLIFDDEYISSGGQLYELAVGHDRFVADLRPYFMDYLDAQARTAGVGTPMRRLCCRPYDLCTLLIAEAAGVIVTDGRGNPVDAPLDTISDVAWAGYANATLHARMQPILTRLLDELAPSTQPPPIHLTRPWGHMWQYALNASVSVKIVTFAAGAELSRQFHRHRSELYVIVDPGLHIEVDGRTWVGTVGETVWLPPETVHRVTTPVRGGRLVEIAFGHFDESDVVRLADRYGRTDDVSSGTIGANHAPSGGIPMSEPTSPIAPATQPETIHLTRPWGTMVQYALNTHTSVKIVEVQAGAELSKQYHHQRAELWVMLDPGLHVELDGRTWEAAVGEEIWIPVGAVHRLIAPNNGGRLLEVAFGHFDEADIVRLSDRYGRTA